MNEFLIFNHHSLPYNSIDVAKIAVLGFLKVCLKLKKYGFQTIFFDEIVDRNWFRIELATNYFWQNWYEENKNEAYLKNQIQAFLSLKTKSPLFSSDGIASDLQLFEVKLPNYSYELSVLRAAVWYDWPIISYPTKEPWNENPIMVNVIKLNKDGENKTLENITNYFDFNKIDENNLRKTLQESISSGEELWKQKNKFFPNLDFCGDSQYQLRNFNSEKSILEQIKNSLFKLNEFSEKWKEEYYKGYSHRNLLDLGLNVSGESQTVSNNSEMRSKREFHLPNGKKEYFENHIKLNHNIRIHFYPNANDKKIYIGYIGKHLPTKKWN